MKEYGDKIPTDKKEAIETAVADLKEAHKVQDIAKIDAASETLNAAWQAASQDIYAAQQAAGGAEGATADAGDGGTTEDGTSEDVTDVEFEEVDDTK